MSLSNRLLRTFVFIFFLQLVFVTCWSVYLLRANESSFSDKLLTSVTRIDESILDSVIFQNKIKNFHARDLIVYKLLELNRLDSARFESSEFSSFNYQTSFRFNCKMLDHARVCFDQSGSAVEAVYPLSLAGKNEGYLILRKTLEKFQENNRKTISVIVLTVLAVFLINFIAVVLVWIKFLKPELIKLLGVFNNGSSDVKLQINEFTQIKNEYFKALDTVVRTESEKSILKGQVNLISMATQVAHDIRSPLEVFKSLKNDLKLLPFESQNRVVMALDRIEEVAFNLLEANRFNQELDLEEKPLELLTLINELLISKKIQFKNNDRINIYANYGRGNYGSCSTIKSSVLKSILSNLINNSVESFNENGGTITVGYSTNINSNVISISDNGSGISPQLMKNIFSKGFTTKFNGNGIGLSNAMKEINAVGGDITVESLQGSGTTFNIVLPKSRLEPSFLVKNLYLYPFDKIVILDDDPTIHEVWQLNLPKDKVVEHYYSIKEFSSAYPVFPSNFLLLTDLDLLDNDLDGISLICSLDCKPNSVLVSAMLETSLVKDRIAENGIKVLPKFAINHLNYFSDRFSVVLIDDDKFIHQNWLSRLEKFGIEVKCFFSIDAFLLSFESFSFETFVFVDSHLGDIDKGEVSARKIYEKGYKNIFLSTGYEEKSIEKPFFIKRIFSKSPQAVFEACFFS